MSECLISRRSSGNSKILNLDKLSYLTSAESKLSGELTGNISNEVSTYDVKVGGTKIFSVVNRVPELLGITQLKLACTSIGNNGLRGCTGLTSLDLPASTSVGGYAFYKCTDLTSLDLPSCTYIGDDAMFLCSSITSINLPVCTYIGVNGLCGCTGLTSLDLPSCTYIGVNGLYGCTGLTSLDLPSCTYIGNDGLCGCTGLAQLTIGSSIQTIIANAFEDTKSGIIININRAQGTVSGAPWGAANAVIHWTGDA
ncbi:MAG TPA: hypothetical protein DCY71_04290 [Clostridiaceae bacterium]|nr:hypothetical protein [Clostridiaceae bacterium]